MKKKVNYHLSTLLSLNLKGFYINKEISNISIIFNFPVATGRLKLQSTNFRLHFLFLMVYLKVNTLSKFKILKAANLVSVTF